MYDTYLNKLVSHNYKIVFPAICLLWFNIFPQISKVTNWKLNFFERALYWSPNS